MGRVRIAIIESPNPMDLFDSRSEAKALEASCRLLGHETVSFFAKSRSDFQDICKYLAVSDSKHSNRNKNAPLFIHISSHGNEGCVSFGPNDLSWEELTQDLLPLFAIENYKGSMALAISACGSGENQISSYTNKALRKNNGLIVPQYIFSILGCSVNWDDALVAWILLYHKVSSIGIENKAAIIKALEEIDDCIKVKFAYKRWDKKKHKYLSWPPTKK